MSEQDDEKAELAAIVEEGSRNLKRELDAIVAANPVPETGWLIELKPSVTTVPTWFHLDDDWTTDASKALRFARKQDADAFIEHSGWTEAFATEHEWSDPPALTPKEPTP